MLYLRISGTPRERGQQHGETYREEIAAFSSLRGGLLREALADFSEAKIAALCQAQLAVLAKHPDLHAEFIGIAEGANLPLNELVILNNHTDMRNYTASDAGCSVVGVLDPEAEVSLCGQTWDMAASALPYVLHLEIDDPACDSPTHILTITGCLGMMGVGANNVSVLINDLKTAETGRGLIWPALVRCLLSQKSAESAAKFLAANLPCSGHFYQLMDAEKIIGIETTGQRYSRVGEVDQVAGHYFHTNHYLGDLQTAALPPSFEGATTRVRYANLENYFQGKPTQVYSLKEFGAELFGTSVNEKGVCVLADADANNTATCGGMLLDMQNRRGVIFHGGYQENRHRQIIW